MKKNLVVLYVILKKNKILLEKRPVKGFLEDQYLIPGGGLKDLEESLEEALKREMMEELSVTPLEFELLTSDDIPGLENNILKPFFIKKWQGEIPNQILDKEDPYPLHWISLDEVSKYPIEPSLKILKLLLQKYITK